MKQKALNGLKRVLPSAVAIVALCALYEGYRRMGLATDDQWPVVGGDLPVKTNQVTMPELSDIVSRFFEPQQRRSSTLKPP